MIGGWASFTGLVGGYAGTAIEKLLPVRCVPGDDRINWAADLLWLQEKLKRRKPVPSSNVKWFARLSPG